MRLTVRLSHLLEKQFGLTFRVQKPTALLGRQVTLVRGTNQGTDYDTAWTVALAIRSRRAFDVGANVGWTALLMFLVGGLEEIVLFDANPLALSIAAENLIRNGLSQKARFFPGLLSDKMGEKMKFYTVGSGSAGSIHPGHAATASSLHTETELQTTTLDNAVRLLGVVPDFVKIDVEGAESLALAGFSATAGKNAVKVLVEMHSNPDLPMRENADRVLNWCEKVGYKAWYLKEHVELLSPNQIEHRGRCHLLLQDAQSELPGYIARLGQGDSVEKALDDTGR
jgi:FkbM family methyltransferase